MPIFEMSPPNCIKMKHLRNTLNSLGLNHLLRKWAFLRIKGDYSNLEYKHAGLSSSSHERSLAWTILKALGQLELFLLGREVTVRRGCI